MSEKAPGKVSNVEIHKDEIVKMIGFEPGVINLLSGGIARKKDGTFRATTIGDDDLADGAKFGYLGGVYRMFAAAALADLFPLAAVMTNSRDLPTGTSHASVYRQQLIKRGVTQEVLSQSDSVSTRGEEKRMIELSLEYNWNGPIVCVTNDYHIDRVKETFERLGELMIPDDPEFAAVLGEFQARNISVAFVPAERVLEVENPRYVSFFEKLKKTEPYASAIRLREESEARGIAALKANTYQKRS